ncbi:MAG: hypothetical protein F6K29_26510, partial [Okeania sp. SIO2G5]|nr:hypothetical protein [Okeania sp. SIO2G5]
DTEFYCELWNGRVFPPERVGEKNILLKIQQRSPQQNIYGEVPNKLI